MRLRGGGQRPPEPPPAAPRLWHRHVLVRARQHHLGDVVGRARQAHVMERTLKLPPVERAVSIVVHRLEHVPQGEVLGRQALGRLAVRRGWAGGRCGGGGEVERRPATRHGELLCERCQQRRAHQHALQPLLHARRRWRRLLGTAALSGALCRARSRHAALQRACDGRKGRTAVPYRRVPHGRRHACQPRMQRTCEGREGGAAVLRLRGPQELGQLCQPCMQRAGGPAMQLLPRPRPSHAVLLAEPPLAMREEARGLMHERLAAQLPLGQKCVWPQAMQHPAPRGRRAAAVERKAKVGLGACRVRRSGGAGRRAVAGRRSRPHVYVLAATIH
mmetsp:Transcript_23474/g.69742  ORF Transcript_23474/g.69742 Transcript_23474/m.69742 type:complete len:332 (+) Transcript_23474:734-1729(+)